MKKILILFGTRPEAIKMAPIVQYLKNSEVFISKTCLTAQHREMLDQVMDFFELEADYDLDLMTPNQTLHKLTARIISELEPVLKEFRPDYVFVHGDTTTTMAGSIAAFYSNAIVCHVEAGLRTHNKRAPFPEEVNRGIVGKIADFHFAPTTTSKKNLINEGIKPDTIKVTGNTVIDALKYSSKKVESIEISELESLKGQINWNKKVILVTGHRRENFGDAFQNIFLAIKELSKEDVEIIYPVHLNPNVKKPVYEILSGIENVHLISPLSYPSFVWLMKKSYFIISDSGGIQEEAPFLGKPVLVLREATERPEAVESGTVKLVGSNIKTITSSAKKLLHNYEEYKKMSLSSNPFGSGDATEKIINFLKGK